MKNVLIVMGSVCLLALPLLLFVDPNSRWFNTGLLSAFAGVGEVICLAGGFAYPFTRWRRAHRWALEWIFAFVFPATLLYWLCSVSMPPRLNTRYDWLLLLPPLAIGWLYAVIAMAAQDPAEPVPPPSS